ncbi:Alpha/Beta hydrolase protein [Nemania sp. FL0031]|nr:Alpha/Beta hydrolase protein [Nemania sp. FL0031]
MPDSLIAIGQEGAPQLLKVRLPFPHRLNCFIRLWILKILASIAFAVDRLVHPPTHCPTLIKTYQCRPALPVRIFYPPDYRAGDLLPLYLNIHGGGFAICDARQDDDFCILWAKRTGMLIVSLNYSKAPLNPFPTPVIDIATVAEAVIIDKTLPIDKNRIVIGGFSAGATLALGACQLAPLKGNIKAILAFYPIVDWSHPPNEKLDSRPYKGGPPDSLEFSSYWFDWAYVSPGQNRCDPVLSPAYANKEDLPPWVYLIGAQWDLLRLESQKMIHSLAELETENQEDDFEIGKYKWTLARGCSHGFTHHFGYTSAKKIKREKRCEVIYEEAVRWLEKVLSDNDGLQHNQAHHLVDDTGFEVDDLARGIVLILILLLDYAVKLAIALLRIVDQWMTRLYDLTMTLKAFFTASALCAAS